MQIFRRLALSASLTLVFASGLMAAGPEEKGLEPCHSSSYLDQDYRHVSIQNQIRDYRQIYDEILEKNPQTPYQTHSSRLFDKLQNAFILTRKYIQDKVVTNPDGKVQDKGLYLSYLDILHKASCKLNEDREMTPLHFERLNAICALIGSQYRHYDAGRRLYANLTQELWKGEGFESEEKTPGMAEDSLKEGVESTVNFIKTRMDNSLIGHNDAPFRHVGNKNFFPLAILYMDREIPIGYQTFVNQFFGPYPLFLASFFPAPVPTTMAEVLARALRPSKEEVHFSHVVSLFHLLFHDYVHREINNSVFSHLSTAYGIPWTEYLRPTYNLIDTATPQAQRVLNAGLFLLLHELQLSDLTLEKEMKFNAAEFDFLHFIIDQYKIKTQTSINERETSTYKILDRDNEYILQWAKNRDSKPFIPLIKVAGEERFLPTALNERGIPVIVLEADAGLAKIRIFDQEQTSMISYDIDLEDNMLLPQGWRFLLAEERRIPEKFFMTPEGKELRKKVSYQDYQAAETLYNQQRQKKLDLSALRQTYAKPYLITGFQNFWDEFEALAKPAYNEQK